MLADLHTHTTFSDGSTEIEQMPRIASRAGLTHLAIADHDTPFAAQYAYAHPCLEGVALIPAVELTALDPQNGRRVHFLCYYPELTPSLMEYFNTMRRRRNEVAEHCMLTLEKLYPLFDSARVRLAAQRSGAIYKTHLMRHLFELGYTNGIYSDLYRTLFGRPDGSVRCNPAYESVDEILALARQARAVVVLAHPSVYNSMELCASLAKQGRIDGIEIEHPRNTPADKAQLRVLAAHCGLLETGGTDFHGMHMSKPVPLGNVTTNDTNLQALLLKKESAKTGAHLFKT